MVLILVLILTSTICLLYILKSLVNTEKIIEYDSLICFSVFAFIVPQQIGVYSSSVIVNDAIIFYSCVLLGYLMSILVFYKIIRPKFRLPEFKLNYVVFGYLSFLLSIVGFVFYLSVAGLDEEATSTTLMSGKAAFFVTFSSLVPISFVMALYSLSYTGIRIAPLIATLVSGLFYIDRIIIGGRRSSAIELFCILASFLLFRYKLKISRYVLLIVFPIGVFFLFTIHEYRNMDLGGTGFRSASAGARFPTFDEILVATTKDSDKSVFSGEKSSELWAASYITYGSFLDNEYDIGAFNWNMLVHSWVPAFLVGYELKDALKIQTINPENTLFNWKKDDWVAITGIAESYRSFSVFGVIKFFIIAYVMKGLLLLSKNGNSFSQMLYITLLLSAMHSVPHHTGLFLNRFILLSFTLIPCIYISRMRS